ncbi:MAG: amylo-alpha-1,6-glucosidase [bacterium]|nr:amylo-alpha-1,6-glucosidase [bacterium]
MKNNISFDAGTLHDFARATEQEWLETNGLGGYAGSTVIGANTRRYHGLLVSAGEGLNRFVLLAKLEDAVVVLGRRYDISCNQYQGSIHPGGHFLLSGFERYPFPTFHYDLEGVHLKKEIFMVHGEETTVILYTLLTPGVAKLLVRPLLAFRDYHSLGRENPALDRTVIVDQERFSLHPYPGMPTVSFHLERGTFSGPAYWYRDFLYVRERERGLDDKEDLFSPGECTLVMTHYRPAALVVTAGEKVPEPARRLRERELNRREGIVTHLPIRDRITEPLTLSADQFLVRDKANGSTIVAGYPWFTDWGRDAMISLEGLTLCTGRYREAREILLTFSRRVEDGLIPNRSLEGTPEKAFNSVDASLLFIRAVIRYVQTARDGALLEILFPVMENIISSYTAGTQFGIQVDPADGLLHAGQPGMQLTWMDAKVGDWVVTPRQGKPVEVNVLWHHALYGMAVLAEALSMKRDYLARATRARFHFARRFWYAPGQYLYDVIDTEQGDDPTFRPNQVMAIALEPSLLGRDRARTMLQQVQKRLLTPLGLRSLDPEHEAYRKRYDGAPWERDSAYHQGTVWPWWMGFYVDACLQVMPETLTETLLDPLLNELARYGIGTIGEIFDGDSPHNPAGCPAQAWSVAEVLRSYINLKRQFGLQGAAKKSSCTASEITLE